MGVDPILDEFSGYYTSVQNVNQLPFFIAQSGDVHFVQSTNVHF